MILIFGQELKMPASLILALSSLVKPILVSTSFVYRSIVQLLLSCRFSESYGTEIPMSSYSCSAIESTSRRGFGIISDCLKKAERMKVTKPDSFRIQRKCLLHSIIKVNISRFCWACQEFPRTEYDPCTDHLNLGMTWNHCNKDLCASLLVTKESVAKSDRMLVPAGCTTDRTPVAPSNSQATVCIFLPQMKQGRKPVSGGSHWFERMYTHVSELFMNAAYLYMCVGVSSPHSLALSLSLIGRAGLVQWYVSTIIYLCRNMLCL